MESVPTEIVHKAIAIISKDTLTEDEMDSHVLNLVEDEITMRRLVDWPPEAFGIFLIAQKFQEIILPTTFSARQENKEWIEFPFKCEPIFVDSLDIAKTMYVNGPADAFETLALRSSTVQTINNALLKGASIDGATLSGPALIGIPAGIYDLPKKTLWQKLFS